MPTNSMGVHLGEISPKCTCFHNIKNLQMKNIPLNVLFPLNILSLNVLSTVNNLAWILIRLQYLKYMGVIAKSRHT